MSKLRENYYSILSEEEKKIVDARKVQAKVRDELYTKLSKCTTVKETRQLTKQLRKLNNDMCEHERSIWSSCIACNEIDEKMYGKECEYCNKHMPDLDLSVKRCNDCKDKQ